MDTGTQEKIDGLIERIEEAARTELMVFRSGVVEASAEAAGRDEYYRTLSAIGAGILLLEDDRDTWLEVGKSPPFLHEQPLSRETFDVMKQMTVEAFTDQDTKDEPIEVMMAMMAIHDLGKSKNFCNIVSEHLSQKELRNIANHDQWLDHALQHVDCSDREAPLSRLMPLLCSLDEVWQRRIKQAFSIELNVGQTLQGENSPKELAAIVSTGQDSQDPQAFQMFLVHFFLDTAGVMAKDLPEATKRFNLGLMGEGLASAYVALLEAIKELNGREPGARGGSTPFALAAEAYRNYMVLRAERAGLDFRAVRGRSGDGAHFARLLCMLRAYHAGSPVRAAALLEALNALPARARRVLDRELQLGGERGLVIYYAPAFMCAAAGNAALGAAMPARLGVALRLLAGLFAAARKHYEKEGGNNNYVVATVTEEVGKVGAPREALAWRFAVAVDEHGKRSVERGTTGGRSKECGSCQIS